MNLELLLEAESRGILPPEKAALLSEARARGLVPQVGPTKEAAAALPNEDGTYGEVPEGMFLNPKTGQYQSVENIKNNLQMHKDAGTEHARTGRDAFISGASQGVSLGGMDELGEVAGIPREVSRAVVEHDRENHPGSAITGEIAGALSVPIGGASGQGMKAATTGGRIGNAATQGARMGAGYGFLSGEGGAKERVRGMATGAGLGFGTGGAVGAGGEALRKMFQSNLQRAAIKDATKGAPTTEQLRAEGQKLYQQVDDAGVQIKPESFNRAMAETKGALVDQGLDVLPGPGSLTPKSARAIQIGEEMGAKMAEEPTAALPFKSLDQLRRHAGTAAANASPDGKTDRALGAEMISRLDDYVKGIGPDDVVAGDVDALQTALPKARDVWSRMSKSQLIDDAIESGNGNYLSGNASGVRNQFARILRNPKLSRGFTDAERKAMQSVVNGSIPETILNYLGSGLGMMAQLGAGFGVGGMPGALIGAATAGASRKGAQALANKKAEIARALVASGKTPNLPMVNMNRGKLVDALIGRGAVAGQN